MPIPIPEGCPVKSITIGGLPFDAPLPFTEGYALRANDAIMLNQVYHENLRNNFAKTVGERTEEAEQSGDKVDQNQLQAEFNEYVADYDFYERKGGFRTADPVMQEAMEIARDAVRRALKRRGHKIADVGHKKVSELARKAIDQNPAIMDEARKRVEAKEDVGLGDVDAILSEVSS